MTELVPASPATVVHEEDSAGDSLLFANNNPRPPAPPSTCPDQTSSFDRTKPDFHSQAADLTGGQEDQELGQGNEYSRVGDSQLPQERQRAGGQQQRDRVKGRAGRVSDGTSYSNSQPVVGADGGDDSAGWLGETQAPAQSMGRSPRNKARITERRVSSASADSGHSEGGGKGEFIEEEGESVSMEFTQARGGLLVHRETSGDGSSKTQDLPQPSESQKENPPPHSSTSGPSSALPFSQRNVTSQSHLHSSGAPSSSPAVARELLGRSPPKKAKARVLTGEGSREPASSADPDPWLSELIDRGAVREGFGPETSTPAIAAPPPPDPLTVARTLPDFNLPSQSSESPDFPVLARSRSTLLFQANHPSRPPTNAFASSEAMSKPPPPRPKKARRNPWDGLSQSTVAAESAQSTQRESEGDAETYEMPATVPHQEEPELKDESLERSQGTPKPTSGRTVEQEMDESGVNTTQGDGDDSYANTSTATAATQAAHLDEDEESSAAFSIPLPPRKLPSVPLFNESSQASSPASGGPASQFASQTSTTATKKGKRLSDIPMSSPQATQFEVPATQNDYDVFSKPALTASTQNDPTQNRQIDNSENWHASFAHDTSTNTNSRSNTSTSIPGRSLKRNPPPPTPVQEPIAPQPSTSSSRPAPSASTDSQQNDSLGDPTQLELPTPPSPFRLPQVTQNIPESSPEVPLAKTRKPQQQQRSASPRRRSRSPVVPSKASAAGGAQGQCIEETDEPDVEEEERPRKKKQKKAVPTVKKAPPPAVSKGKGKGKALAPQESPDELDMLSAGAGAAPVAAEETNYSELPSARNAKKRSPLKAKSFFAADKSGKGKKGQGRRGSASSREDEPMEEEKEEEEEDELEDDVDDSEAEAPPPRKKRRTRADVEEDEGGDEEQEEEEEPAVPRGRRRPTGKGKGKEKLPAAPKAKKTVVKAKEKKEQTSRGRRSRSTASNGVSRSPEPQQPVAGPSRLRFNSVDDLIPAGAASPALTDAQLSTSNSLSSKTKSRLPSTAPFDRVIGLWRDNGMWYPAQIVSVTGKQFKVVFSDKSKGKLNPDEIRRAELRKGDLVVYNGNDYDTETQQATLEHEVKVQRVLRDDQEVEEGVLLQPNDIVVVASLNDSEGRIYRIKFEAIVFDSQHASQLDDRKLSNEELAAFDPRILSPPLALLPPPTAPSVKAFAVPKSTTAPFARTAFLVTYAHDAHDDKPAFLNLLKNNGATVLEWEHLFTVNTDPANSTSPPDLYFPKINFEAIDNVFLLADRACTTLKYLVALALGIPCLSKQYAIETVERKSRIDWKPFLITAGYIKDLNTYGIGGQLRALTKSRYDFKSVEEAHTSGGVFVRRSFLVVMGGGKKTKTKEEAMEFNRRAYNFLALLSSGGASLVNFVSSPSDAASASSYDHVFLDDGLPLTPKLPTAIASHKGLVNIGWLKQCLQAGRLLRSDRMEGVEEGARRSG